METPAPNVPKTPPHTPPLVPGMPIIGNMRDFARAEGFPSVAMLEWVKEYGPVITYDVAGTKSYLVADPDLVHEILVKRIKVFRKPVSIEGDQPKSLRAFVGQGILTGDHDEWRPQRKLMQPLMHTKHIQSYAGIMVEMGERLMTLWEDGAQRDIHDDMNNLTLWVISKVLFGETYDETDDLVSIEKAINETSVSDIKSLFIPPPWLPTRRRHVIHETNEKIDAIVNGLLEERRSKPDEERGDLFTLLMNAVDEEGNPPDYEFIRNNTISLFMAGHDTTANTLTWVFYYLDRNPQVLEKLIEEIDTVLEGRKPTFEDLDNLKYTEMVIKETMRIEPAVTIFPRVIQEDTTLGDYQLEGPRVVMLAPYVLHHLPELWPEPDKFDPERFSEAEEEKRHKFAYLPFSGGARVCIGNHFSMMEMKIMIASILTKFRLERATEEEVIPFRAITTGPKEGLPMIVRSR